MIEDKLLIWRFKYGSTDALRLVYKKYKDNLLRLATALLNDVSAAEDIVHDVFVTLAQSADRLKLSGNLKSYLATCVANRARNYNRKTQQRETADLNKAESAESNSKRPAQWIIYTEQLKRLNSALAELPYQQKRTSNLLSHLGITLKKVKAGRDFARPFFYIFMLVSTNITLDIPISLKLQG